MRLCDVLRRAARVRRDPRLDDLVSALRAPAGADELRGEQAMVAALAAERRRTASLSPSAVPARVTPRRTRTLVVTTMAALALLGAGGTAVAARSGRLPDAMQRGAHRLLPGLAVPAPTAAPSRPALTRPSPSPPPSSSSPAIGTPGASAQKDWCVAWRTAAQGGHPMNGRDRRDLITAAGGEEEVAPFCARLIGGAPTSAQPGPAKKTGKNDKPDKSEKSKKPKSRSSKD
ncbi:hypothetical protein [Actinoplanes solisilvae]|uniref:hypothetical protein n=1 Tax=Actinoplanes solisilvae TaxID=2486853 RepID=UPI000FDAA55E|nr:hypothetical protein [Actinoplanes solisilvae]